MTTIIQNVAVLDPAVLWSKKKSGTPISTAVPKQMSCRFVSPNITLDFTFVRSFGTVTYANLSTSLMRPEQTFAEAAGLEQREAQKDRVSHAGPDRPGEVPIRGDTLYQHRINPHADHD